MKSLLKSIAYALALILVCPLAGCERILRVLTGRDVMFAGQAELLSLVPGKVGWYLRNAYYFMTLRRCPLNCCILVGTMFTHSEASVGNHVYLGSQCIIGMVEIGDHTLLADHVYLLSGSQQHGIGSPDVPIQEQEQTFSRVVIGANVWIGTNTVVMADIGSDTVVGAGSVVTRPVPESMVVAGNPARVLRSRDAARTSGSATG
jgi:virginiamycin A acetyltransferase